MNRSTSNSIAASSWPMLEPSLLVLVAMLIAAPAGALTTSSKRYAVHEINFDHANATDWGGTDAGPYQELDCRAELSAAPSDAAQATSIVPRTSGGNNTFKIPLFYDGIVTVGGTNVYRWKLRIAGNTTGTYRYKVVCNCSLIATESPSYCTTKPSFHSATIGHTHTVKNATTSEMDDFTWEGRGWLTTDGARSFRYDRKDMAGNPDNRTILNGIFSTGTGLAQSQNSKGEKRSIGYEESHIDTLARAAAQSNFNAIVIEVYRGWTDDPAIVNKDVHGSQNAAANLEGYLCKTPQTCGGNFTDCNCPDKLHPFENKGSDKARMVPAYWQSLDVRLKKIVLATTSGRKSMTAAIKLGQNACVEGTQGFGSSSGLPHKHYKHFLLYLIGRYGAYNVLWMGHQETDEMDCHSTGYISAYLDWMHRNDPYFRLTSNHKLPHTAPAFNAYTNNDAWSTGPISPRFLGVQETDGFGGSGNLDEAGPDDTAAWDHARSASWGTNIPGLSGNPKPWVNMEYGFERRTGDDDRNQADQVDLDLLEDVWGAMLGGAAGMFYGNNWIKPGSQSSIDTGRLDDPGFKLYHKNMYRFFDDADADPRYWEWNAFKKVVAGATAYTLSCKQNDSCVLNFLETNDQDIDMSAKGPDDPAFAFGSTVHLRWYDVRKGCWEDTGTTSFIAGPANHVTRPGDPTGGSNRWVAVMQKDTPYGTLSAACSGVADGPVHALCLPSSEMERGPIPDKTLLIHTEQGAGDAIQFARYLTPAAQRCRRLILVCRADLMPLFSTIPGIAELHEAGTIQVSEFDTYCPLLSLPLVFGTTLETIPGAVPYLDIATLRRRKTPSILPAGTRAKIGIVWAGSPTYRNDRHRSIAFSELLPILRLPDFDFYSLQKGERCRDLPGLPPDCRVQDLDPSLADFGDTALVIDALDLVITVDTAVAHLAGALAKPVWTLLPEVPDWRWGLTDPTTPWYPSMRLFRQDRRKDWTGVMGRVSEALLGGRR